MSNESEIQNRYINGCIKSVFPKLAHLLRVWQRNCFHKTGKKSGTKKLSIPKKNSPFTPLHQFLNLKHIEQRSVNMLNLVFYIFKGKQLK